MAQSAPATVSITVTRAPACDDVSRRTAQGVPVSVPLTCTDPDGDPFTLSIADGPSKGSLGAIVERRGHLHAGRRRVRRGLVHATARVTARRLGAGHRLDHDHARAELRRRRAHDGGRRPRHGAALLHRPRRRPGDARRSPTRRRRARWARSSGGAVTYTPDDGAFGADSFTYTGSDGVADSAPATVSITITRPPACDDVARRTGVDTAVSVPLACTDPGRRSAHALDRGRPVEGLARPDQRRIGALHARRRRVRHGHVHLRRERRHRATRPRRRSRSPISAPAELRRRGAPHRGRRGGLGGAELHRSRGRRADAVRRGRARARAPSARSRATR